MTNNTSSIERLIVLAFILLVCLTLAYYTPSIVNTLQTALTQTIERTD
jgi:hypothetical protein